MAGMVVTTLPSFSSYCPYLGCSFPLCCASPRTSPCLGSQSFCSLCLLLALLLCLLLALLLSCLLLALLLCLLLALLFSVLFNVAPDLRCYSRCPRTRVALLRSSHHLLLGCGSSSDSLTTGSLCGRLRLHGSFLASSNITTQRCALCD